MKKFSAILSLLIPQVINEISTRDSISEISAVEKFYSSKTYELLELEETAL